MSRQASTDIEKATKKDPDSTLWRRAWRILSYTPRRCRYDPEHPPVFSLRLNLLFGFAATFSVANLYYNHPILNKLAEYFHVSNQQSSLVPTLAQVGYACGLLFLCPLGDLLPRRSFILTLVFFTVTCWIGLCVTKNFSVFCFLSFLTSVTTVTPQLMLPLAGDLAIPSRRATALSIVVSGLLLGVLLARVLSGIVAQYTSWRNIYWLALGLQYAIGILLWLFLPEYPSKNPQGLTYPRLLWSIITLFFKHPLLVQSSLIGLCTSTNFTSFWTTLTFLLSSPPYNYSSLVIGLFALIGISAVALGPVNSRYIIDRYQPLFSVILGEIIVLVGAVLGTFIGPFSVAGPILQAFLMDFGVQMAQIANRAAIFEIEPQARNRTNTIFMVSVFVGQIVGTSVGNALYATGGWHASGAASIGFIVLGMLCCAIRGPRESGWVGWTGGWSIYKRQEQQVETDNASSRIDDEGQIKPMHNEIGSARKEETDHINDDDNDRRHQ